MKMLSTRIGMVAVLTTGEYTRLASTPMALQVATGMSVSPSATQLILAVADSDEGLIRALVQAGLLPSEDVEL